MSDEKSKGSSTPKAPPKQTSFPVGRPSGAGKVPSGFKIGGKETGKKLGS